jgi:hypothetical protein
VRRAKARTAESQRQRRRRSKQAARALVAFSALRRFFAHDNQLARALGWDVATTAEWRAGRVVRPQRAKIVEVARLMELCEETRAYLRSDADVGTWVTAPMPNLGGLSPAAWLQRHGHVGLRQLTHGMVDWMPKVREADLEPIDSDEADAALQRAVESDEGAREFQRMLATLD